jgi:hypothetical protein
LQKCLQKQRAANATGLISSLCYELQFDSEIEKKLAKAPAVPESAST